MKKADRNSKNKFLPKPGIVEWFRLGDYERVRMTLKDLKEIGIKNLRTCIYWSDWQKSENKEWFDWLLPQLHRTVQVLPCFVSAPPITRMDRIPTLTHESFEDYVGFVGSIIENYHQYFDWVEIGYPPNGVQFNLAASFPLHSFKEALVQPASLARKKGKKIILGGINPTDPESLQMMFDAELMDHFDAIGFRGYPFLLNQQWNGWEQHIRGVEQVLKRNQSQLKLWITETGYSSWPYDEVKQWREFINALNSRVERVFWRQLYDFDFDLDLQSINGIQPDVRECHFGLKKPYGKEKLLYKLLKNNGIAAIDDHPYINYEFPAIIKEKYSLVTGGAGFIGANVSKRLLSSGKKVMIFDNLDRPGVDKNLQWLYDHYNGNLKIQIADIRDVRKVKEAVNHADQVFNFSAQVAVTTSLQDPAYDFDVNIKGTLNLLEAIRKYNPEAPLIFTSTNKVYGNLADLKFISNGSRYYPANDSIRLFGINEDRHLDFHSPYGCSKGSADQYVIDYARSYHLNTAVFRMSCVYGPHQFGTEDQGWVAHFIISALENRLITIYGDGKQVRDILFVDDLIDAFFLAMKNIKRIAGSAFNIGGGPGNTVSLLEILSMIKDLTQRETKVRFEKWRTGDQLYYVSDIRKFSKETGWIPQHSVAQGIGRLTRWISDTMGILPSTQIKTENELTV